MKKKRVLIAENDPDHIELLVEELKVIDTKKETIIKKDGLEVMDYFKQPNTNTNVDEWLQIDLIILDLNLPEIHGMEVLRYLKNDTKYRLIPVIIFLNTYDTKTISEVYEKGANGFITKPASFNEFRENIKKLKKYLLDSDTQ
jgi:two-component system, response regulator